MLALQGLKEIRAKYTMAEPFESILSETAKSKFPVLSIFKFIIEFRGIFLSESYLLGTCYTCLY